MKRADRNRSTFLVMVVFAIALLVAAAAQYARMRASQVPSQTAPASQR
jgi:hypothetical protein